MTKGAQKMVSRFYTLPLPTPNPLFPAPIESKSVFAALWGGDSLFSTRQPLSNRHNIASFPLLYYYFHGKCFHRIHSLVTSVHS